MKTIETVYWQVDPADAPQSAAVQEAARRLGRGEVIAFPTETVYGLGADARNTDAVARIFAAKGRPADNPLIVHIADPAALDALVGPYHDTARLLMRRFWPGPLTLVLPLRAGAVSPLVSAGLATVAVRMPAHPIALALIAASGCPIAAPSANRSGRPSPTLAAHVREDLHGAIDGIVDGGPTGVGLESTVVEVDERGGVQVLRPGGITLAELREIAPDAALDPSLVASVPADAAFAPRSPGMKYTHYAPKGELTVVESHSPEHAAEWIRSTLAAARSRGQRTGVLTFAERAPLFDADLVVSYGRLDDAGASARELYAALRAFDENGIDFILGEPCQNAGIGFAVNNRLRKAAGNRWLQV